MLTYFKTIRPKPVFLVDQAANTHSFTGEFFATVRPNGRILDESRFVIGGNMMIDGSASGSVPLTDGSGAGSRVPKTYRSDGS